MTFLVTRGIIPLYPGIAIVYPLLFVCNMLWIMGRSRRCAKVSPVRRSVPISLWIVAAVFTVAGVAGIVAYLRSPSMPLGVQAIVAVLLIGYVWFLIHRLRRGRRDEISKSK